jgi:hypothetical protein
MRDPGEMHDMRDAAQQPRPVGRTGKVGHGGALDAFQNRKRFRFARGGPDLPSLPGERRNHWLADEAGRAGDKHAPHANGP